MKKTSLYITLLVAGAAAIAAFSWPVKKAITAADVKSLSALAFGPDGILFIGDSKALPCLP